MIQTILGIYESIKGSLPQLTSAIAYLCLGASIIVKLTPTLKDDNIILPIIKFIGKYIAIDKFGREGTE